MSITPAQCRAGRALVGMSQSDLAEAATVSRATLADFERDARAPHPNNLFSIRRALENAGVEFTRIDPFHEGVSFHPIPVRIRFANHNGGIDVYEWVVDPLRWPSDHTAHPSDAIAYEPTAEEMQKVRYLPALIASMKERGIKFIPLTPEAREHFNVPDDGLP